MTRDYGVLYNNSRPFVVPIPLLSVDPLAIAINTGILSLLPAFSHLLPTNRLYAAQTCENIGTPHSPFFFSPQLFRANRFYDAKILPDFCGLPSFFFQNTHNLHCISYSRTIDVVSSVFFMGGSPLLSCVQQYNRTGTSWPSNLEQVPDLCSDTLTNDIGTSMHERVYAWVHMTRDYVVLYNNSRPFVVPMPLLSVDPPALTIILVSYSCLPAFSQLLPTNRLYAVQTCEKNSTPPSPFFFPQLFRANRFYNAKILPDFCGLPPFFLPASWLKQGLFSGKMCYNIRIIPAHFCSFAHQTRVHAAESFQTLWPFFTWQIIAVFPTDLVDNAVSLYVNLCQTNKVK